MSITKEKALQITVELFSWLAKNPRKKKCDWPGWKGYSRLLNFCACCEYVETIEIQRGSCHYTCPIKWLKTDRMLLHRQSHCGAATSPYRKWVRAIQPKTRTKYAKQVVNLAKKALKEGSK